jgi:ubiquitin-protein ligase
LILRRLELERLEMSRIPRLRHFRLGQNSDVNPMSWSRYYWTGETPTGHLLRAQYPSSYPYRPLVVTVDPPVHTSHRHLGALCLMYGHEWSPNYTAATNILIAFRFLHEHRLGLTAG